MVAVGHEFVMTPTMAVASTAAAAAAVVVASVSPLASPECRPASQERGAGEPTRPGGWILLLVVPREEVAGAQAFAARFALVVPSWTHGDVTAAAPRTS